MESRIISLHLSLSLSLSLSQSLPLSTLPLMQYNDRHHPIPVKVSFFFLALLIIFLFLTHFYPWKYGKPQVFTYSYASLECTACVCYYVGLKDLQGVLTRFHNGCRLTGVCTFLCAIFLLTWDWLFSCERWKKFWKDYKVSTKKIELQ